jgi:hypothetical protein
VQQLVAQRSIAATKRTGVPRERGVEWSFQSNNTTPEEERHESVYRQDGWMY